jgi:hypothetical protein
MGTVSLSRGESGRGVEPKLNKQQRYIYTLPLGLRDVERETFTFIADFLAGRESAGYKAER